MDLHNRNISLLKGELDPAYLDRPRNVTVSDIASAPSFEKLFERPNEFTTGNSARDAQLAADLDNRIYSLLKYKVAHEQPNLQPSRRYMSMDAMRMLAEEQSIKPELETINAIIRSHPEIPKLEKVSSEIRRQQKPYEAEKLRPFKHEPGRNSDITRALKHGLQMASKSKRKNKGKKKGKSKGKGGVISPVYFTLNPYKMSLNEADQYSSVQELYNHDDHVARHGGNERHIGQMLERNLAADPNSLKGFNFYAKNVTQSIDSEYDWHPGYQKLAYNAIGPKYTRKY